MRFRLLVIVCGVALMGCATQKSASNGTDTPKSGEAASGAVGADRDEHGCIPSAGYQWCPRTDQCERPWELARTEGFDNVAGAFDAWCAGTE